MIHLKKILVLGAGRVARPCVKYLLEQDDYFVTVVDQSQQNMDNVLKEHPKGKSLLVDVSTDLGSVIKNSSPDIVINLLPANFMVPVAKECLKNKIPMVNPSYIKDDMRALEEDVKDAGLTFICELGLDPGIDHMSAAKTIKKIHQRGGKVESFRSICGAIPSLQHNTNPFGYKLSWAPSGLIGASKREAKILVDGQQITMPDGDTFKHIDLVEIDGLGWFEIYANANSLPYIEMYGIPEVKSIYRGTIRYPGWSEIIVKMNELGLFEENELDLSGLSYRQFTALQLGSSNLENVENEFCKYLGIKPYSAVFQKLHWLGLFSEEKIPVGSKCPRDVISNLYFEKLYYRENEKDLVIMEDQYVAYFPEESKKVRYTSTLIDYGIPGKDTSIARTTGLPPAMGARLILEGRFTSAGIFAPVLPEIYEPLLAQLEEENICFREKEEILE